MVASKSRAFLRTLVQDRRHDDDDDDHDRGNGKRQAYEIEQEELYTNGTKRTTTTPKPQNRVTAMLVGILVFALLQGQLILFGGREQSHPEPVQERLGAYANAHMYQQQEQQPQKPKLSLIDRKKMLMEASRQSLANRISTAAATATTNTASTKQDDYSISLITDVVQSSAKSMLASMEGRVAIFYNVYLPPQDQWKTPRSIKLALQRVLDQLMQIRESSVANVTIQYGLIGHNVSHERLCPPPFKCHRLIYQEKGWEDVTMYFAQEYCQKHPDHTIVYMHNKGSLNNNRNNERIRRITTKAALSDPCVTMGEGGDDDCNVCASQLQLSPFFHYPANIWTAKCSYVRKLVPVQEYSQLRTRMCQDLHDWDQDETCNMTLLEGADAKAFAQRVGLGRHAVERWIVGHPSLIPCEVFPHTYLSQVQDGATDWTPVHKQLGPLYQRQPKWIWRSLRFLLKEFYYVYGEIQSSEEPPRGFCPQMFRNLLPQNPCLWQFPNITPLTERAKNQ